MIKAILLTAVALLAIAGLCEFLHSLRIFFILPERPYHNFGIVFLKNNKAVRQLKFAVEQRKWMGVHYCEHIVAVYDDGLEYSQLEMCRDMAGKNDVLICPIKYVGDAILALSNTDHP